MVSAHTCNQLLSDQSLLLLIKFDCTKSTSNTLNQDSKEWIPIIEHECLSQGVKEEQSILVHVHYRFTLFGPGLVPSASVGSSVNTAGFMVFVFSVLSFTFLFFCICLPINPTRLPLLPPSQASPSWLGGVIGGCSEADRRRRLQLTSPSTFPAPLDWQPRMLPLRFSLMLIQEGWKIIIFNYVLSVSASPSLSLCRKLCNNNCLELSAQVQWVRDFFSLLYI